MMGLFAANPPSRGCRPIIVRIARLGDGIAPKILERRRPLDDAPRAFGSARDPDSLVTQIRS
jgi:hypothetical protein